MFGGIPDREADNGHVAEAQANPKVFLPRQEASPDYSATPRVTLPRPRSFFEDYPRKWTWDSWARRVEHEGLMVARGMEAIIWGTVGALLGLAASGVPGAFLESYPLVVWQPLGAAVGAAVGALLTWHRWIPTFRSHRDLSS